MKSKCSRYSYHVLWSEEDNEYVGRCSDFPSLSWLSPSPEKALKGIKDTVADTVLHLNKMKETVPGPTTEQNKDDDVLDVLNKMIAACEPIQYHEFNKIIKEKEKDALGKVEREDDRVGVRTVKYGEPASGLATSTTAIMATITDICVGKRLAFQVNEGVIVGFQWYSDGN